MLQLNQDNLKQSAFAKYKLVNNSLRQIVKSNPKDMLVVEIGDVKDLEFHPQVKICRWGTSEDTNEVNFSIRAQEEAGATLKELPDGTIVYKAKDYEVHQYDKPDASEEGGYEIEVFLTSKPNTNIFEFTISTKGLDFFYQPALTQAEIDEGASRPPEVIGSYAVYHATKGGMNDVAGMEYKVGKFCHIYRPKAIDANGVEVWADLHIENGILTVTVPQKFLDDAVYPVRVDPTFGYTSIGATGISLVNNTLRAAYPYSPTLNGTLDSLSLYHPASSNSANFRPVIYTTANVLVDYGSEVNVLSAGGWYNGNFDLGASVNTGTNYKLGFWIDPDEASALYTAYDSNVNYELDRDNIAYHATNVPPDPFTVSSTIADRQHSIYATYTASGGGTSIKDIIGGGFIMFPR